MSNVVKKQIKSVVVIVAVLILLIGFSLIVQGPTSRSVNDNVELAVTTDPASGSSVSGSAVSGSSVLLPSEQIPLSASKKKKTIKIKKLNRIRYAVKTIKLHKEVSLKSKTIKKIPENAKIKVVGKVVGKNTYKVSYKGKKGFIKKKKGTLTKTKPFVWHGSKLTPRGGVNMGPSGKETYYNMAMGHLVARLHQMGLKGKYWVRKDGVKCFGKYVMVAANLKLRPRGSLVKTSLGMGIVADTGGFAYHNPRQLDIAVTWGRFEGY